MSPIADCDLEAYLKQFVSSEQSSLLQTSFGCLTAAVSYLHQNRIRHKDIKPKVAIFHLLTELQLTKDRIFW
jgi:serine/threonine protein kinase